MRILILRHGIAIPRDDPSAPQNDAERPLTARGIKRTRRVAKGMAKLDLIPDAVFTSPYLRARQTAELVILTLGSSALELTVTDALLPEGDPEKLRDELSERNVRKPLCVGHAPHVDDFVARLVGASAPVTRIKKAGLCSVAMPDDAAGRGTIVALYAPKVLVALR
jgi:phosphohistidine phosphatase